MNSPPFNMGPLPIAVQIKPIDKLSQINNGKFNLAFTWDGFEPNLILEHRIASYLEISKYAIP